MKKRIVAMVACCLVLTSPVYADDSFNRVIKIDLEISQLISERDGIIASKTDTVTPLANYETKYGDGQYKVGADGIPAGEYVFFATGRYSGSFKETTDSNGTDRVHSEYFDYNMIYTLTDGNYVEIEDAIAVPSAEVTELITNKGNGVFKVGVHIPAGEYRIINTSTSGGSYKIWSTSYFGNRDDRISSDYFSAATYITVHDGEYLMLDDALFIE